MKLMSAVLVCLMMFAGTMAAVDVGKVRVEEKKGPGKLWWTSVFAMVGASAVDAHSSWGRQEMNPVLANENGRFGGKGIALKAGIAGGIAVAQYFLMKKSRSGGSKMAIMNFGMAGVLGGVAMYNHNNSKGTTTQPAVQPRPDYLVAETAASGQ